ncbi:WYL domain-containing protein [Arcanobacterium haemolyticum]|uniref:Transcriptional regulator protein n=1 Tax=Arcanobacterium haemolyticum (strain ATCC 9345 / DSM 20595 / CCM 5947 / CCUG 17215 / LMG 16163 / NBRC 15585 / NCTC 8452 / 11018) TaxID=644284 RepID=D7BNU1_ARCHD|nr:WYL domain-containing protein [Arcanobacterium haemolyticum]ADH92590.1 transcriptional regulator protein [Arcanobacterium haemolyticum DSM 20595]QCX46708.1 WYL domain-containing protein [Arcanobacterium haemolyticum]SQH28676.1 Uncharacterised protein [Arcanobacterium haemolyticum]
MSTSVEERRFTLLTLLSREPATSAQIGLLPAYRAHTGVALQRMIERDIQTLRLSGHVIVVDSEYRYRVDDSAKIRLDVTGVDVTAIRRILGTKRRNNVEAFAQFGATKVIGSGEVSGKVAPYRLSVPVGDSVVEVADAITVRCRIRFSYDRQGTPVQYVVEPWRIGVHFGAFYLVGAVVSRAGCSVGAEVRTFRLSRVIGQVEVVDLPCEFPVVSEVESDLSPVDVVLLVADPRAPLARRGRVVAECDAGVLVAYEAVDRWDIVEEIVLYQGGAEIVEPAWLRDQVAERLDHAMEVLDGVW